MKKRSSTISTQEITVPVLYEFYGMLTDQERESKKKAYENLIRIEEGTVTEEWSKKDKTLVQATKAPRFYEHWKYALKIIDEVIEDIKNGDFDRKIKMAEKARKSRAKQHASGS